MSDEENTSLPLSQTPDAKVEAEWREYVGLIISLSEVRSTVHCCSKVTNERSLCVDNSLGI